MENALLWKESIVGKIFKTKATAETEFNEKNVQREAKNQEMRGRLTQLVEEADTEFKELQKAHIGKPSLDEATPKIDKARKKVLAAAGELAAFGEGLRLQPSLPLVQAMDVNHLLGRVFHLLQVDRRGGTGKTSFKTILAKNLQKSKMLNGVLEKNGVIKDGVIQLKTQKQVEKERATKRGAQEQKQVPREEKGQEEKRQEERSGRRMSGRRP